ncbi:unnamed protein product [Oikopleura dioica]|uniref:Uncharacterized protein n=1 Tax=Oikopleura dioica TaxID=34765 RepID=E4Y9C7_OIKDI|nr:unnamed protein product [Oikopleura dioica]
MLVLINFLINSSTASFSEEYKLNPENFYRDPCPDSRPTDLCNALDEYVWRKDETWDWYFVENTTEFSGVTGYTYKMNSLKWLDNSWWEHGVDGSQVWRHLVTIWVPNDLDRNQKQATLAIGGGNDRGENPRYGEVEQQMARTLAIMTKTIGVYINAVPNGPLKFYYDWVDERKADQMVSWSWRMYLENTHIPELLCWLPMVKASLRAMDMTEILARKDFQYNIVKFKNLIFFITPFFSKIIKINLKLKIFFFQVNLIVPVVATVVDYKKVMHSWLRNLGGSALAVAGYYVDQIIQNIDHPNFADFGDPMIYKERLTMAKLVIPATMDYFFQITDTWSFFDDLPGEKYLRLLPNSEHSTALSGVSTQHWILTFRNLLLAQMTDYKKSPTMTWTRSSDAGRKTVNFQTSQMPVEIYAWVGDTRARTRRDWRIFGVRGNEKFTSAEDNLHLPYPEFSNSTNRKNYPDLEDLLDNLPQHSFPNSSQFFRERENPFLDPEDIIVLKNAQLQANFWHKHAVIALGNNQFEIELQEAPDANRAFFIEAKFPGFDGIGHFEITSEVHIIPEINSFADCFGSECAALGLV